MMMNTLGINNNNVNLIQDAANNRLQKEVNAEVSANDPQKQQANVNQLTQDTLVFSDKAELLRNLSNEIAELPIVDSKRVEQIQRSLATGAFNIDANNIADKLLDFENSLSKARSG